MSTTGGNGRRAPRVPLGRVLATPNALARLEPADIHSALERHARGDWGEVNAADRLANDNALRCGARILSVYRGRGGARFWVITEADRSATTLLLPEDY